MTMSNNGLTKLIEECGEVIQVAAKLTAYPSGNHPGHTFNLWGDLQNEMADAIAAMQFVARVGWAGKINETKLADRTAAKLAEFNYWHAGGTGRHKPEAKWTTPTGGASLKDWQVAPGDLKPIITFTPDYIKALEEVLATKIAEGRGPLARALAGRYSAGEANAMVGHLRDREAVLNGQFGRLVADMQTVQRALGLNVGHVTVEEMVEAVELLKHSAFGTAIARDDEKRAAAAALQQREAMIDDMNVTNKRYADLSRTSEGLRVELKAVTEEYDRVREQRNELSQQVAILKSDIGKQDEMLSQLRIDKEYFRGRIEAAKEQRAADTDWIGQVIRIFHWVVAQRPHINDVATQANSLLKERGLQSTPRGVEPLNGGDTFTTLAVAANVTHETGQIEVPKVAANSIKPTMTDDEAFKIANRNYKLEHPNAGDWQLGLGNHWIISAIKEAYNK